MSGHRCLDGTDEIEWGGRRYRRHPEHRDRHRRVYYMATTAPRTYLHRDVYSAAYGPVPNGWHVHHIDHDPSNNDITNLAVMSPTDHAAHHGEQLTEHSRRCDECDRPYATLRPWSRWCSAACKERRRRRDGVAYVRPRNPWTEQRVCAQCGHPYTAKRPWARFCSQRCRNRDKREKP